MSFNTDMLGSSVEAIILKLLRERMMYGYEIIKVVNERTQGAFTWKEGTLYPCLHRLEVEGVISSEWQPGAYGKSRKYYHLTRKGERLTDEKIAEWKHFSNAVNAILLQPAG